MQRFGRANHRIDEASRAVLVPANRFEVLECRVASMRSMKRAGHPALRTGRAGCAGAARARLRPVGEPSSPMQLYREVLTAAPYSR